MFNKKGDKLLFPILFFFFWFIVIGDVFELKGLFILFKFFFPIFGVCERELNKFIFFLLFIIEIFDSFNDWFIEFVLFFELEYDFPILFVISFLFLTELFTLKFAEFVVKLNELFPYNLFFILPEYWFGDIFFVLFLILFDDDIELFCFLIWVKSNLNAGFLSYLEKIKFEFSFFF